MDVFRSSILKSDLITFFVAKDGEAGYSEQKQNLELTVAQIMSSKLQNWRKKGKIPGYSGMT